MTTTIRARFTRKPCSLDEVLHNTDPSAPPEPIAIELRKELTAEQELEAMKQLEASALRKLLEQYPADEVCRKLGISRVTLWRRKNALLKGK